ncbi:MAG TPA: hypothetical protein DDW33_09285 [Ktedonobacter sp.]|jgi:CubicO group peptidase (beta-lactamase class C family)|nr:hypothetical protein [Ktedonobacter sp.]HAT46602.1 hypothetical protein [Ktedonobacter sp.]HBE25865.1 hypothetical protein [Ktedonobacter sp.]HCF88011.1 hypothetical protein [Ktedonobacter sp.]
MFQSIFSIRGEGKKMLNHQQTLEPVRPVGPEQLADRHKRWRKRYLWFGLGMVAATSLLLIVALIFALQGATQAAPRAHPTVLATPAHPHVQQPTPTEQATPTPQTALIESQVDSLLRNKAAHQQFSGSVLIAQNGHVLLSKGYSVADWDDQAPNTPHTRFYLGSTTKQFTAMAILILQERGKLHVHDHLCSYIAHCPAAWQPLTIHELLTHTSGIPQLDDSQLSGASPEAWIASYDTVPLAFAPGSHFDYCSVCYQILGYVVQQASHQPYNVFLQQAIFDPLQMKDTGFDPNYLSLPDHAVGYAAWQVKAVTLGWSLASQWSFLSASGLLTTTVEDMYRWDEALDTSDLVTQQTLDEAFTPYVAESQYPGSGYGYGWFIAKAPKTGHPLIWHDGRIDGFRTYNGRDPDDQVTIIFLSNLATLDELALANTLDQIVFSDIS